MVKIPFIGQAYTLPTVEVAFQRCLNWYLEAVPGESKNPSILKQVSGHKLFATVKGANREIYTVAKGRMFSVNGNKLTEISPTGTNIERGNIGTNGGNVSMADNGTQLIIVDGFGGNIFDLTSNVFSPITNVNFPDRATHVTFQDGYFIVNKPNSTLAGEFYISDLYEGFNWNGLDFGNAESSPDIITALKSTGRELWLFGSESSEVWVDTGALNFPWQRIPGAISKIGIAAPFSLALMETNIFWLGGNKQGYGRIFTNQGYRPREISTPAIVQEIVKYPSIEDAKGWCYQEGGHRFYVISFRTASKTWVFDVTTGAWHERAYTDFSTNTETQYRGNSHAFFNGKNYVADPTSGNIYEVDPETLTDNGNKIKRLRNSPHVWNGLDWLFISKFQVDMEVGRGNSVVPNPQGMLRWNDDGHSWSNQMFESLGKVGEYSKRVDFNRLGVTRRRVWEFTVTDEVKATLLGAYIEADDG